MVVKMYVTNVSLAVAKNSVAHFNFHQCNMVIINNKIRYSKTKNQFKKLK